MRHRTHKMFEVALIRLSNNGTRLICSYSVLFVCVSFFIFTVSVHPLLHGNCGSCFIHRLPAHLSGHLLLLQVTDSLSSCGPYRGLPL